MGSIRVRRAAESRDLTTLETVKNALRVTSTTNDAELQRLITAVSETIEEITDRRFARELVTETMGVDDMIDLNQPRVVGQFRLMLRRVPILAIEAIRYDDDAQDLTDLEFLDGVQVENPDAGFLFSTGTFPTTHRFVQLISRVRTGALEPLWEIDYSAGYVLPSFAGVTFNFVPGDVSAINDTIAENTAGLVVGDTVRFKNTGGALPAPLNDYSDFYVRESSGGLLKFASRKGGAVLDITDAGTGTHTVTRLRSLPASLEQIAIEMVNYSYTSQQRDPSIKSERLLDHAVTYTSGADLISGMPAGLIKRLDRWRDPV